MELVYLWVEEYKNIHKQGFNFSPKFNCHYDDKKNELTINENDDYIENFFGDNINVTAIVGKNGSGKSSIFEVLSQILIEENGLKYFYVLFNGSSNKVYANDINVSTALNKEHYVPIDIFSDIQDTKDSGNIALKIFIEMYYLNISHLERDGIISNDAISLKDPLNYLGIYAKNDFEKNTNNSIYPRFSEFNLDKFNFLQIYEIGYLLTREKYTKFFFELFQIKKPTFLNIDYDEDALIKIKNQSIITSSSDESNIINKILTFLKDNKQISIGSNEYKKFFELASSVSYLEQEFKLTFLTHNRQKIKFSSGEKTILYYLYQIHYMLARSKKDKNMILLWDEIELYLHPAWQRRILKIILDFVKTEKLDKLLHIILTSHSPFLLSDIPKQNIIFLDKDENGNCKVVDGLKEKKQTFGANIHTLLSDSFFMEDGLVGEFAKDGIDKVITLLNQDKLDEKELKYCEQIISIIGEPIVKNQLQRMLDSKRLKKVDEIDAIKQSMKEMQKRLDELENDKNSK